MGAKHGILIVIAVILVAIGVFILICRSRKDAGSFDERQVAARGTAYKFSFASMVVYFTCSEIVSIFLERDWATHEANLSLGICIPVFIFAILCIVKDAYVGFKQKVISFCIPLLLIGLINILLAFLVNKKPVFSLSDGVLDASANFICGITVTLIGAIVLVKFCIDRRLEDR